MTKFFAVLLFISTCCQAIEADIDGQIGYRRDSLTWDIAGPKGLPVLSKLSWKDLNILEMGLEAKMVVSDQIVLRAYGDYGWVHKGKNRDSDFRLNHKHQVEEYSRSDNNGDKGNVADVLVDIGYACTTFCPGFCWTPLIGLSWHAQNLHITDLHHTIQLEKPDLQGTRQRVHARYDARWWGPSIGVKLEYAFNECTQAYLLGQFRWLGYRGTGHWKKKAHILGNFHHTGNGPGAYLEGGVQTEFTSNWRVGALVKYQYAHLTNGKDSHKASFPVRDEPDKFKILTLKTKLCHVTWHSVSFLLSLGRAF